MGWLCLSLLQIYQNHVSVFIVPSHPTTIIIYTGTRYYN